MAACPILDSQCCPLPALRHRSFIKTCPESPLQEVPPSPVAVEPGVYQDAMVTGLGEPPSPLQGEGAGQGEGPVHSDMAGQEGAQGLGRGQGAAAHSPGFCLKGRNRAFFLPAKSTSEMWSTVYLCQGSAGVRGAPGLQMCRASSPPPCAPPAS